MNIWTLALWLVPVAAFGLYGVWRGSSQPTCGDFLVDAGIRLETLRFKSCEPDHLAQVPVLRARYEVPGARAAEVETRLQEQYGMAPLKFVCCGWEPANGLEGQRRDARGNEYVARMTSGETTVNQRTDWPKIKSFFVQVDVLLEQP